MLGADSVTAYEMASAYGTFAAEGWRSESTTILEVRRANGGVLYQATDDREQVFDTDVMANTTAALRGVVEDGSGSYAGRLGRDSAGKTGTVEQQPVRVVRRLRPAARDGRDDVQAGRRRQPAAHAGRRRTARGHRWLVPGPDLDRIHAARPGGRGGDAVPDAVGRAVGGAHAARRRPRLTPTPSQAPTPTRDAHPDRNADGRADRPGEPDRPAEQSRERTGATVLPARGWRSADTLTKRDSLTASLAGP